MASDLNFKNFSASSLNLNALDRRPQSFVSRFGTTSSCARQILQIQKNTGYAGDKKKNNDNHGDEKHKNDHLRVH